MAKLDSNAAWREATGLVAANRDIFLVLSGVFFLLPSLALSVIAGEPEMTPGMDGDQMVAAMTTFYADAWPLFVVSVLLQAIGIVTLLTLMRDRSRPTVAEAIKDGFIGGLIYIVAQLLFFLALGLVGGFAIGATAVVSEALALVMTFVLIAAMIFALVRLMVLAPVIAVEEQRNPFTALRRSWVLTKGNFWRIFGFLALIFVLFLVVISVVMLLVGLVLAVVSSGETQRVLAAVVSSTLVSVALLYGVGVTAGIHRQLAGPGEESLGETFA